MRGFTLVEMLVVLVIIGIVTTIALVGQSTFNKSLMLTNTAYTVALSIREMQSLGLSSRKFTLQGQNVQNPGYGVHLSTATPGSYILFADTRATQGIPSNCATAVGTVGAPDHKPGNCLYDSIGASVDGIVRTYNFGRGFKIDHFCGKAATTGDTICSGSVLSELDISFLRSNTETIINGKRSSGWVALTSAEIYIKEPEDGNMRAICVSSIGQVSVTGDDCL